MKLITRKVAGALGLGLFVSILVLRPVWAGAQFPFAVASPQSRMAQHNALSVVLSDVSWLESATRSAPSFATGGYGLLVQRFDAVRTHYDGLKSTLTPKQLTSGANQLRKLDTGLVSIQQAFSDYQAQVANEPSRMSALRKLCQVVNRASRAWAQELKRDCWNLRVGW